MGAVVGMSYRLDSVPAWILDRAYGCGSKSEAACILALHAGSAAVAAETPKAVLVEWQNTELFEGPSGGEFWCPKSLLEEEDGNDAQ